MLVYKKLLFRSAFTCNTRHGVCERCYGRNLATGDEVEVGEAVGTVAAQSIGEPRYTVNNEKLHQGGGCWWRRYYSRSSSCSRII